MTTRRALFGAVFGFGLVVALAQPASAQRMIFATQDPGTLYHTLGSGMAALLTQELGRQVTVQPYGGSSVYLPLLDNGEATLGFSSSLDAGASYRGEGRAPLRNLRAVARIIGLRTAMMVRAQSGIRTVADLKGKRVVLNLKGQRAMGQVIRAMLAAGGLGEEDVQAVTLGNVKLGAQALIEGNVDATFIAVGIPLVQQAHAAIPGGVRYADIAGERATQAFLSRFADGLYPAVVEPAPHLPEVPEPVTVAAFDVFLLTGAGTPEEDVQAVLRVLWENFDRLQKDYPQLRASRRDLFAAATNTVPYHPGAVAFYREIGLWSEANEAREQSFAGE